MTSRAHWATTAVLTLAASLALVGCSRDDNPPASPPLTPTASGPSPSPSPTPTPPRSAPAVPEAATANTEAGARAFSDYFVSQVVASWTKPASGLLLPLSDARCKFCESMEKRATDLVTAEQRYATSPVALEGYQRIDGAPEGQVFLAAVLIQNRAHVVDASGKVIRTDPARRVNVTVGVVWGEDGWKMLDVENRS